jgi:succinyl-diaminopimelate desuccinylase
MGDTPRSEIETLVTDLVRINTENPPGNERPCAEYIHEWFTDHNIDATLIEKPQTDRPQVAARVGREDPTLVLNGHIDVVPAGDQDMWTHDPYGGVVEEGQLYGRGSADMKTGVALAMLAALDLSPAIEAGDLNGSLVIHAAIGEETGAPGTKVLLEEGFDGDYGVVLEPTNFRTATSAKGLGWYEIIVTGEPSHASQPDQGTNAITAAHTVLDALSEYDQRLRQREDDLCGQGYATVTQVGAGLNSNKAVLPEQAHITLDRRILPDETIETVDDEIASLLETLSRTHDIETDWKRTETYRSAAIWEDSPLAETFREHSAAVTDVSTTPWGVQGATDVRNFVNDAGIEAITWGPGRPAQAHTIDESIDLAEATDGLTILKRAVRELLTV